MTKSKNLWKSSLTILALTAWLSFLIAGCTKTLRVETTTRGCQTSPAPKYDGPMPVFRVCAESYLCVQEGAEVAWTKYYLRLQSWAEDTESLCVKEN